MIEPPLMNVMEQISYVGWELEKHQDFATTGETTLRGEYRDEYIWTRDVDNGNGELQYYSPFGEANHKLGPQGLELIANRNPDYDGLTDKYVNQQRYRSGMIMTHKKYSTLYGRIQSTMKLPKGAGLWSAFWMNHEYEEWPARYPVLPELDILEYINQEPNRMYSTVHTYENGPLQSYQCIHNCPFDITDVAHTFGVDWSPRFLKYWVDGQVFHIIPTPADFHHPMHLLWNLAVGGTWPGPPRIETPFPSSLLIKDWHVYKYVGTDTQPDLPSNDDTIPDNADSFIVRKLHELRGDIEQDVDKRFDDCLKDLR